MASQGGVRVLSLDGGGTRIISSISILRELMERVVPGHGGTARPCEYFDLIGGSGIGALCALLFVRFCNNVDQVVEFVCDLAKRLDKVEDFYLSKGKGEMAENDWNEYIDENPNSVDLLAAFRQRVIDNCWQAAVEKNISDPVDRFPYMSKGVFDFKAPSAVLDAGRAKAWVSLVTMLNQLTIEVSAAMTSESPGYGQNGGVDEERSYHVPFFQRTYECRWAVCTYTFYAVGLGTVAYPDIIKPGVIFPKFLTTGRGSIQNPINMLLEECNKLWPGLRIGTLLSIGVGTPDVDEQTWRFQYPKSSPRAARACLQLYRENLKIARDLERYTLPHNKMLQAAYCRLELPKVIPFFEFTSRKLIIDSTRDWMVSLETAEVYNGTVQSLKADNFPSSIEAQVALSSLANLLTAFETFGHTREAEIVTDVIANFVLYEGTVPGDDPRQSLLIAAEMDLIAHFLRERRSRVDGMDIYFPVSNWGSTQILPAHCRSGFLNQLSAYDDDKLSDKERTIGPTSYISDLAAQAHCLLRMLKRKEQSWRSGTLGKELISSCVDAAFQTPPQGMGQEFCAGLKEFLQISTISCLCQAACVQTLRGSKQLLYNGPLLRHISATLKSVSFWNMNQGILSRIADFLALCMRMDNWSPLWLSDWQAMTAGQSVNAPVPVLCKLLSCALHFDRISLNTWSFVNLAIELLNADSQIIEVDKTQSQRHISRACRELISRTYDCFDRDVAEIARLSVDYGLFGLLSRCLRNFGLGTAAPFSGSAPSSFAPEFVRSVVDTDGNTLMHRCVSLGYPSVFNMILHALGTIEGRDAINRPNLAGRTPLHIACANRAPVDIFRLMFLCKADVNRQCNIGCTPLHYCFPDFGPHDRNLRLSGLEGFYSRDEDIRSHDDLFGAEDYPTARLLEVYKLDFKPRLLQIIEKYALPTTVRLNFYESTGSLGKGFYMTSTQTSYKSIIHQLLCRGADARISDHDGMTPLHRAAKEGWWQNMECFFTHHGEEMELAVSHCLKAEDKFRATILSWTRMNINGQETGSRMIMEEMQKRGIEIKEDRERHQSIPEYNKTKSAYDAYKRIDVALFRPGLAVSAAQKQLSNPSAPPRMSVSAVQQPSCLASEASFRSQPLSQPQTPSAQPPVSTRPTYSVLRAPSRPSHQIQNAGFQNTLPASSSTNVPRSPPSNPPIPPSVHRPSAQYQQPSTPQVPYQPVYNQTQQPLPGLQKHPASGSIPENDNRSKSKEKGGFLKMFKRG